MIENGGRGISKDDDRTRTCNGAIKMGVMMHRSKNVGLSIPESDQLFTHPLQGIQMASQALHSCGRCICRVLQAHGRVVSFLAFVNHATGFFHAVPEFFVVFLLVFFQCKEPRSSRTLFRQILLLQNYFSIRSNTGNDSGVGVFENGGGFCLQIS